MKTSAFYARATLSLLAVACITLALAQPLYGARADFSAYNTRWNGASAFTQTLEEAAGRSGDEDRRSVRIVQRALAEAPDSPAGASLVLLGPEVPPTAAEAEWLRRFVQEGGRVLIAADFGGGNAFLEALGAESRLDGDLVLDFVYQKKPPFVVTSTDGLPGYEGEPLGVVLSYATAIRPAATANVLASTGASAWLDRDGDAQADVEEPAGPLPWLAIEPVGAGEVLLLSDPSVLINSMRDLADNAALAQAIASWLTQDGRTVVLDESHIPYPDPLRVVQPAVAALGGKTLWGLAFGLVGGAIWWTRTHPRDWGRVLAAQIRRVLDRIFPAPPEGETNLVDRVRKRHPDWNETTLNRILARWREQA